jgi:hypothetical protein
MRYNTMVKFFNKNKIYDNELQQAMHDFQIKKAINQQMTLTELE